MIKYISTRNSQLKINSSQAILNGPAPGGGLYIPDNLEEVKLDYHDVINSDFKGMAKIIWAKFFPDFGQELIDELVERSYTNKFSKDEITPLVKVGDDYILELYHGPTAAFKDVALSALPNLMTKAREMNDFKDEILILTATSGDTGSAALCGFSDVPGTRIIVFYPDGGVSETQKLQMTTAAGANTCAVAVKGNFDDAQTSVKNIFRQIPQPCEGVSLSSANSINIGRLVPQIVYYFSAYSQLVNSGAIKDGDEINFTVPTGNFGNILAGYYAKIMGLPIRRLICASNKNDVLKDFMETGHYDRNRTFFKTTSPSMDILISSNLERLLFYIAGEQHTIDYCDQLRNSGEYQLSSEELHALKSVFTGIAASDEEGAKEIGETFASEHYLMDTHTAVAWSCSKKFKAGAFPDAACLDEAELSLPNVVLSTASPYKFCRSVLEALGEETEALDEANMLKCEKITGAEIPGGLKGIFGREVRHKDVIEIADMKDYVLKKSIID